MPWLELSILLLKWWSGRSLCATSLILISRSSVGVISPTHVVILGILVVWPLLESSQGIDLLNVSSFILQQWTQIIRMSYIRANTTYLCLLNTAALDHLLHQVSEVGYLLSEQLGLSIELLLLP